MRRRSPYFDVIERRLAWLGGLLIALGGYVVTGGDSFPPVIAGSAVFLAGIHAAVYGFIRTDFGRLGRLTLGLGVVAAPAAAVALGVAPSRVPTGPAVEAVTAAAVYMAGIALAVLVMRMLRISGGQHDTDLVTAADLEDGSGRP